MKISTLIKNLAAVLESDGDVEVKIATEEVKIKNSELVYDLVIGKGQCIITSKEWKD